MPPQDVAYLVFDVEAVSDGELIQRTRYPTLSLSAAEAIARYRREIADSRTDGKDFVPYTFLLPASVAVAKVTRDFRLLDVTALDEPAYRPHVLTAGFWQGWRHYGRPTLVTFNGRGFDLPLMELCAFRYGVSLPDWFNVDARSFDQLRNRYHATSHLDLMDLLSNFGASRMVGGLNLLANLIGKPGKAEVEGAMVQDMFDAGRTREINDYCVCDVLDTYFVFLRTRVMLGKLALEAEQIIVDETKAWLESQQEQRTAFRTYLQHWGDWQPPIT